MITLNSEQGLTTVDSWEDIEARAGFVTNLNPAEHKLESIIGRYLFKDKIRCGLSNCHSPHAKGYIVTTKEGLSTNIGKDCGKNISALISETMSKKFDRDRRRPRTAHGYSASVFKWRTWSLRFLLCDLTPKAPTGFTTNVILVTYGNGCPAEIVRRISEMLKTALSH